MGEREPEEREAALALRDTVGALRDAASSLHTMASDVARWGVQYDEPSAMRLMLADIRTRLGEVDTALAEWDRSGAKADGVYIDDYSRLTHGYRWHVVRDGVIVSRGWSWSREDAENAARAAWAQADG